MVLLRRKVDIRRRLSKSDGGVDGRIVFGGNRGHSVRNIKGR